MLLLIWDILLPGKLFVSLQQLLFWKESSSPPCLTQ
jgi:hypothetical protein